MGLKVALGGERNDDVRRAHARPPLGINYLVHVMNYVHSYDERCQRIVALLYL